MDEPAEANGCGHDHHGCDGGALRPIIPLPTLNGHTNGNGHAKAH